MAPHHGSRRLDAKGLMGKTKPAAVVSSQARPTSRPPEADPYEAGGARFLPTWKHGAVTFRSHASGLVVETFLTRERFVLRAGR
jgi:beta-lactamase superfamily II metal-dependent hydrolase